MDRMNEPFQKRTTCEEMHFHQFSGWPLYFGDKIILPEPWILQPRHPSCRSLLRHSRLNRWALWRPSVGCSAGTGRRRAGGDFWWSSTARGGGGGTWRRGGGWRNASMPRRHRATNKEWGAGAAWMMFHKIVGGWKYSRTMPQSPIIAYMHRPS